VIADIENSTYPIIKLKLGSEHDESIIGHLRDITGKAFRIDANGAWTPEEAQKMVYLLSQCNVDLIEQPTSHAAISEWPHIKGNYKVPFIMDEGLNTVTDYYKYADYIDGVNIKMSKSGGILNAQKLAVQARKNKRLVMIGSMVETSIGISQAIYLSSLADYFDLDGPLLLKNDVSSDIIYEGESISVGENIIGGPVMKREFLNG
jgi:L-alanine-DL-glutamate epimerase-like enolase superfamily enzyme